jgi:hypothetical protein
VHRPARIGWAVHGLRSFSGRCRRTVSRDWPACSVKRHHRPGLQFSASSGARPSLVRAGSGHQEPFHLVRGLAAPRSWVLPDCLRRNGACSGTPLTRRRRCPYRPGARPPPAGLSSRPQCWPPLPWRSGKLTRVCSRKIAYLAEVNSPWPAPRQRYCGAAACRCERRQRWQRAKRECDADYRENQRGPSVRGRKTIATTGARTRAPAHPPHTTRESNRNAALRQRDRRHAAVAAEFAKMDASTAASAVPSGFYRVVSQKDDLIGAVGRR